MIIFALFRQPDSPRRAEESGEEAALISLDSSIIAAILIFLVLIFLLNRLLFQPLLRIQAERESRTTGLVAQARRSLDHHLELFDQYQATLKKARLEGYRRQEQVRSEALRKRAEILEAARKDAEHLTQQSRDTIQAQVKSAKEELGREAREIARGIAVTILQRSN